MAATQMTSSGRLRHGRAEHLLADVHIETFTDPQARFADVLVALASVSAPLDYGGG